MFREAKKMFKIGIKNLVFIPEIGARAIFFVKINVFHTMRFPKTFYFRGAKGILPFQTTIVSIKPSSNFI